MSLGTFFRGTYTDRVSKFDTRGTRVTLLRLREMYHVTSPIATKKAVEVLPASEIAEGNPGVTSVGYTNAPTDKTCGRKAGTAPTPLDICYTVAAKTVRDAVTVIWFSETNAYPASGGKRAAAMHENGARHLTGRKHRRAQQR